MRNIAYECPQTGSLVEVIDNWRVDTPAADLATNDTHCLSMNPIKQILLCTESNKLLLLV